MLKNYFIEIVKKALNEAITAQKLGNTGKIEVDLVCEIPKNKDFGDFAINVSMLSRFAKMAPNMIANIIKDYIKKDGFEVNVAGGFINFKLENEFLNKIVKEIIQKQKDYLKIDIGKGQKVDIEYVSANPTGPFHIGHGRWAALGSALANILKYDGYNVIQEFYINDAGGQIEKLAKSLEIRVRQLKGEEVEMPADLYPGEYLIDCAKMYIEDNKGLSYADFAKTDMLNKQKELLKKFKTNFDVFFSELDLYKSGEVEKCMEELKQSGKIYKKDDALWFKSSEYGDDRDRVLVKSDGKNTYLTSDIAYHKNKFDRGFDMLVNIWGADHHGYILRMKAAIEALGYDSNKLVVLLGQLVNIIENGEKQRMGKRKKMVTLDDLVDEVGTDATRFWMIMRSIDTTIDFDIDLAKEKSDKNPVFYVQYAHARACSILRKAIEKRVDVDNKTQLEPYLSQDEIDVFNKNPDIMGLFDSITGEQKEAIKSLILKLEEGKALLSNAVKHLAPYMLCKYLTELATAFHHFYNYTRVLSDDKNDSLMKLALVNSFRIVMATMLELIGVEPVEKM